MRSLVAVEQGLLLAVHLWVGHAKSLPLTSNFDCLKFNLSWICFVWKQMADNNFVAYHPLFNGVCGNSSKEHPTIFWIQLEGNHCLKEKVCRNMNSLFVVLSTNTDIWSSKTAPSSLEDAVNMLELFLSEDKMACRSGTEVSVNTCTLSSLFGREAHKTLFNMTPLSVLPLITIAMQCIGLGN